MSQWVLSNGFFLCGGVNGFNYNGVYDGSHSNLLHLSSDYTFLEDVTYYQCYCRRRYSSNAFPLPSIAQIISASTTVFSAFSATQKAYFFLYFFKACSIIVITFGNQTTRSQPLLSGSTSSTRWHPSQLAVFKAPLFVARYSSFETTSRGGFQLSFLGWLRTNDYHFWAMEDVQTKSAHLVTCERHSLGPVVPHHFQILRACRLRYFCTNTNANVVHFAFEVLG